MINMVGKRYSRLIVISRDVDSIRKAFFWNCLCDCGKKKSIQGSNMRRGLIKSCGCLRKEYYKKLIGHGIPNSHSNSHGKSKSRLYIKWSGMRKRCLNSKSDRYKDYGGRGIKICDEWKDNFINFYNDMQESYLKHCKIFGERQTTLDRVNNDGNYEKSNCRWATYSEQNINQRKVNKS